MMYPWLGRGGLPSQGTIQAFAREKYSSLFCPHVFDFSPFVVPVEVSSLCVPRCITVQNIYKRCPPGRLCRRFDSQGLLMRVLTSLQLAWTHPVVYEGDRAKKIARAAAAEQVKSTAEESDKRLPPRNAPTPLSTKP